MPFNLAAHVLRHAAQQPEKSALQILRLSGAERWSFGRLEAAVRGFATALDRHGTPKGARILLRMGNEPAFAVAFLGTIAHGAVPVPTSAQLTAAEIAAMAAQISPDLVIASPGIALPAGIPVMAGDEVVRAESLPPAAYDMGDPDRLAYLVFTSGSSGRPMAVAHAHRAIWARGMMHQDWEGLGPQDRLLHAGAFNWTYTLGTGLMDPWVMGATALIPGPGVEAAQLPLLMKRFDASILAAAPGIYRRILRGIMPALPRLRHGLSAGEALSPDLRQAWQAATGTDLHEALGMTECSTYLSGSPRRPAPMGCTGFPQPGRNICLIDGQIAIHRRDPGLMLGYLDDPAANEARFQGDWFLTGDLAAIGPDGAWTYLGRNSDILNAGGYRVSPREVEMAFADFPGLGDCAAAEIEVGPATRIIALFYEADGPLDPALLSAHVTEKLATYKQPRAFRHLSRLPRGANGKLNRRALIQGQEGQS